MRMTSTATAWHRHPPVRVWPGALPLYRFVGDRDAFQITCQNVAEFGGKWLVVTPAGRAVQ